MQSKREKRMHFTKHLFAAAGAALLTPAAADSQQMRQPPVLTYADLADLALVAPVAAHVRLRRASLLKGAEAQNVPAGKSRFYVEAEVVSLIRGTQGVPAQITYLADVPNVANGKPPKLAKKGEYLVLAQPVPGRPGELRLVAPDAQLPFTAERADRLRAILREAAAADAAPRITAIGKAFHVPGSIPGESETQIFLQTADGQPVSLSVLRRPGETPRWAVALSEMVDDAAAPPQPNSLLWYRLACALPATLPPASFADAEGSAPAIQADYKLVVDQLGRCERSRG
jgi:hypothetical protein